jgi:uncharacterized protein with HEPN domain
MRRDPRAYLWDVREAADAIAGFMQGRSYDAHVGDLMFRSAVERQLAIIGEALRQLTRVDQGLARANSRAAQSNQFSQRTDPWLRSN